MTVSLPSRSRRPVSRRPRIITVTLNTAVDTVLEVPGFTVGAHQAGRRLRRYPAGKGLNVSRALACVGCPSTVTGFVGRDDAGVFRRFIRHDTHSLADSQLAAVAGATRHNITILDPVNRTETHLREAGFTVTRTDLRRLRAKLLRLARPPCVVAFSGSLPPGVSAADCQGLFDAIAEHGASLVLDVAGNLLRSVLFCDGAAARQPWLMIKPNLAELGELLGRSLPANERELARLVRPLNQAARYVVVTRGPRGAVLVGRRGAWSGDVRVDPVDVVSTVGCGDCMLAGLLAGYVEKAPAPEMLRRGLALATANLFQHGAAAIDPRRLATVQPRVRRL